MSQETSKIRVAAYIRVSSASDEQESSYTHQHQYFETEVNKIPNHELVKIYGDQGVSGVLLLERDGFVEMLIDAGLDIVEVTNPNDPNKRVTRQAMANSTREPLFDMIFVKDISRLSRNIAVASIINELKLKNVYIKFLDINKSTQEMDSFLIYTVLQTVAQYDSVEKGVKVRWGIAQSAKKNGIMGRPPYGYKSVIITNEMGNKISQLVQVPHEADVVKQIFNMYASGMGGRKIAKYLQEQGIKNRKGNYFSAKLITPMFREPKYCGINVRNMYTSNGLLGKIEKNAPDNWMAQKCKNIDAIIDEELFYKCQDLLNSKIITQKNIGQNPPTTPFGGLIYCSKCQGRFNSAGDGGKKYICRTRALGGLSKCDNDLVSLETLEEAITNESYQLVIVERKGLVATKLRRLIHKLQTKLLDVENDYMIESLEHAIAKCEKERKATEKILKTRDEDDQDDLLDELKKLNSNRAVLVKQLEKLNRGKKDIENDITDIQQTISALSQYKAMATYTRDEIINDIARIEAMPNGEVKVIFKTEYKISELYAKHNELQELLQYSETIDNG